MVVGVMLVIVVMVVVLVVVSLLIFLTIRKHVTVWTSTWNQNVKCIIILITATHMGTILPIYTLQPLVKIQWKATILLPRAPILWKVALVARLSNSNNY